MLDLSVGSRYNTSASDTCSCHGASREIAMQVTDATEIILNIGLSSVFGSTIPRIHVIPCYPHTRAGTVRRYIWQQYHIDSIENGSRYDHVCCQSLYLNHTFHWDKAVDKPTLLQERYLREKPL